MKEKTSNLGLIIRRVFPRNGSIPTSLIRNEITEFYDILEEQSIENDFQKFSSKREVTFTTKDKQLKFHPDNFLKYAFENRDRIDEQQYSGLYHAISKEFGEYIRNQ